MRYQELHKLMDSIVGKDYIFRESMSRQVGGRAFRNRPGDWTVFTGDQISGLPQMIVDELQGFIDSYREAFAPFAGQGGNAIDAVAQDSGQMTFVWWRHEQSVSDAERKSLSEDRRIDPQTRQRLLGIADFIQAKGFQLLQPPTQTSDPSRSSYGNLNDKQLSDYGYAFDGIADVVLGKSQVPMGTSAIDAAPKGMLLQKAMEKQEADPNLEDRVFYVEPRMTSRGTWMIGAIMVGPDGTTTQVPVLSFFGRAQPGDKETYRKFHRFTRGGVTPGMTNILLPRGLTGPIQPLAGFASAFDPNSVKGLHSKGQHWLDLYTDESGNPMLKKDHSNRDLEPNQYYGKIEFDGPEGGLVFHVRDSTGEQSVHPLTREQVEWMIAPYESINGWDESQRKLYKVAPPKNSIDSFGQEKGPGWGPWDISPEDKAKIRQLYKEDLDLLAGMMNQYRVERGDISPKEADAGIFYTPGQKYTWLIVAPRFRSATVVDPGKARGHIYNPKFDTAIEGHPQVSPAQGQDQIGAVASSGSTLKNAQAYQTSYIGHRDWVLLMHDLNPQRFEAGNQKRAPYEQASGRSETNYATAQAAVEAAIRTHQVPPPPASALERADQIMNLASQQVEKIQQNLSLVGNEGQDQDISPVTTAPAQPATPQPPVSQSPMPPVSNHPSQPMVQDDSQIVASRTIKGLIRKYGRL